MKFYPYKNAGGGAQNVLAMLKGLRKRFHSFKGCVQKVSPCLEKGCKKFQAPDFPIL